jgi:predicted phage terminase large subunit-like protein
MELPSPSECDALLREDLGAFAQRCFHELYASKPFEGNWHLDVMAAKLQDCARGEILRLILCAPPKHMKSFFASVVLVVWLLGHDPTIQIINVTYGDGLSEGFARDRLALMNSRFYQRLFATRLNKESLHELTTTAGGGCLSTSVGGVLTGRGADVIILDDIMKVDEAQSDVRRKAVNEWFAGSLVTRLNDQRTGRIILCMHRLHPDDLVGHVLEHGEWELVSLAAIAEQDESYLINTPLGQVCFRRKAGELLHPARMSQEDVDRVRKDVNPRNFASLYQQSPAPSGGAMVKAAWFGSYSPQDLPEFDLIVQSWDTAAQETDSSSFSACTTWGISGKEYYLLHVLRQRLNYTALKRAVQENARAFDADVILIENRSSGIQLIEDMIAEGVSGVTPYEPKGGKRTRLYVQTAVIENGFVHLRSGAPWRDGFLDEVTRFPSGHNDQVDSMSQFLDWVRRLRHPAWSSMQAQPLGTRLSVGGPVAPTLGPNFGFGFVNNAKAGPRMVRLKVPTPGPTHVEIRGVAILVPPDRIIEVTEEDPAVCGWPAMCRCATEGLAADSRPQHLARKARKGALTKSHDRFASSTRQARKSLFLARNSPPRRRLIPCSLGAGNLGQLSP